MSAEDQKQERVSRIVAAYASRPDVSPDEIVALYRRLSGAVSYTHLTLPTIYSV
mgnify:CR=1 FL=1